SLIMHRIFSLSLALLFTLIASAQTYTLQQCIDTALANSIPVQQVGLQSQAAAIQLNQSRNNVLPDLSADVFHGLNQGRSIDPNSNSYVNQSLNFASYQLNSAIRVFGGGELRNTIRQNATAYEATKLEYQQAKDVLTLNVILAYLQVLNAEDLVGSTTRQAELSQKELERLQVLNSQGAIKPSELSDLKGQLMNDQLSISNARNTLELAKLSLAQLMNKAYSSVLTVERLNIGEMLTVYSSTADQVYEDALGQFAQIKAAILRTKSYEYGVKAAKGGFYPTVSLGGGFATNYSSTARNAAGKISYNGQLSNNISSSLGVGISVPIFNRFQVRNRVKLADIFVKTSELQEESIRLQLRQQIDQAYLNMTNAYDRYKLLLQQVAAYTQSFNAAEVRYKSGVGTSYDYLIAKDRLDRANTNLITAQYDFVFRKKVLEYYSKK
ncbi:MAG: TolC family protein, partial [Flaviaesturariibacter sp.]|nr:TolC family protein [Flaviaesturariibacter sp.]